MTDPCWLTLNGYMANNKPFIWYNVITHDAYYAYSTQIKGLGWEFECMSDSRRLWQGDLVFGNDDNWIRMPLSMPLIEMPFTECPECQRPRPLYSYDYLCHACRTQID